MKSVWWGAIIPGYGQIVNKKYWKLPIVYGGFMGCAFAVSYYSERYNTLKIAYRDKIDNDPTTNSYLALQEAYGNREISAADLKTNQDVYRRYRDLSIFVTFAWYALTVLEAYVDAQLYDFDITPDLSLRVQPAFINNDVTYNNIPTGEVGNPWGAQSNNLIGQENAIGVQWSFTLK